MAKKKKATTALAQRPKTEDTNISIVERMARDPNVNVDKLERLIALQERTLGHQSKAMFEKAFAEMRPVIPTITKNGVIKVGDQVRARYAKHEDIQDVMTPILHRFGFSLRFRTEWPSPGIIRIVGILSHVGGYSQESAFEGEADTSGSKNAIQARGSTVSYGRRYTTCDLLNITSRGQDDDGRKGGEPSRRRDAPVVSTTQTVGGSSTAAPSGPPAPDTTPVITQPQQKRLFAIVRNSGRAEEEVRGWLHRRFGIESTGKIRQGQYDVICAAIEAPGELSEA